MGIPTVLSGLDLPASLHGTVEAELSDGEDLRWAGKPDPSQMAGAAKPTVKFGIYAIVVSTAIAAVFLWIRGGFGESGSDRPSLLFCLIPLAFAMVGIAASAYPCWLKRKARSTLYLVTNRRAITMTWGRRQVVRSFGPEHMSHLEVRLRPDGSGDILFEPLSTVDEGGTEHIHDPYDVGLFGVASVGSVERLLRETRCTGED